MEGTESDQKLEVSQFLEALYNQRKTGYSMVVEKPEADLPRTASKIGGLPFLVPDEPWPRTRDASGNHDPLGHEMTFIMQLRIRDMPSDAQALFGVPDGLFQLFYDDDLPGYNINTDHDYYLARVIRPGQVDDASASFNMSRPEEIAVLEEKAVVGYESFDDWPYWEDVEIPDDGGLSRNAMDQIREVLQNAGLSDNVGGDKLGGYPHWCQGPEWGLIDGTNERYIHLVQFEGEHAQEINIGDSGTMVVQRHPREPDMFKVGWACC